MVDRQLIKYVKERMSHGMNVNELRTLLAKEGWMPNDVEEAISAVYDNSHKHNVSQHHTNFLAISILAIIVLILAGALFLMVFRDETTGPIPPNIPEIPPVGPILTGWELCASEEDSVDKDVCYRTLNADTDYDCDLVKDATERGFCYRAKEAIIMQTY